MYFKSDLMNIIQFSKLVLLLIIELKNFEILHKKLFKNNL